MKWLGLMAPMVGDHEVFFKHPSEHMIDKHKLITQLGSVIPGLD